MEIFAIMLLVIAGLILFAGWLWFLVVAFQESKLWGIGVLLPLTSGVVSLVFLVLHWAEAKRPFFVQLAGLPFLLAGFFCLAQAEMSGLKEKIPAGQLQQLAANTNPPPAEIAVTAPPEPVAPAPAAAPRKSAKTKPPVQVAATTPLEAPDPTEPPLPPKVEPPPPPPTAQPVTLELVKFTDAPEETLHTLKLRLTNPHPKAVREINLTLVYLDKAGSRLKEWTTTHADDPQLAGASTTAEFDCPAYFMPSSTRTVTVRLHRARFTDGSAWPAAAD